MKTIILIFSIICLNCTPIFAQLTSIPDSRFEQALIDLGYDEVPINGWVFTGEINSISNLDVSNKNILDLTGIEDFEALTVLNCNNNLLTSLDVSENTALESLTFANNDITNIDLSQNVFLGALQCSNNQIRSLSLNANTGLNSLYCEGNQLESLDVSQNITLRNLKCDNNQLTSLNVENGNNTNFLLFNATNNPDLYCIEVDNPAYASNNWTDIDSHTFFSGDCNAVTFVPDDNFEQALIDMGYDSGPLDDYVLTSNINSVTSLSILSRNISDLTGIEDFVALTSLRCQDNQLTSLNLSQNTALRVLLCGNNQLESLDVSQNTALGNLNCSYNQLESLDVTQNTALYTLNCRNNSLTNLNVKNGNNTNLNNFHANNNPDLFCVEVDDAAYSSANWINIDSQTVFSEDCSTLTYVPDDNFEQALIDLGFDSGPLNDYVFTENINSVTSLQIAGNNIADLTGIEDFSALTTLSCNSNQLTNMDVSQNTALTVLDCYNNQLTSIDVSKNTALTQLLCANNALTSLDVKNGNNINLEFFNAFNNPDLYCIEVDDASYSETNWTQIDPHTSFSENCRYDETYIPDDNFEQALIDLEYDSGALDNYVITEKINKITALSVTNQNITDLTGIEDFTAIQLLDCSNNKIKHADLRANTALTGIYFSNNDLETLNLKIGNTANLEEIITTNNQNLLCIEVDDATYATANLSGGIDEQTSFSEDCSTLSTSELDFANKTKLYPNPATHSITIKTSLEKDITSIEIYNLIGKRMPLPSSENNTFNISHLASGIYILNIYIEEKNVVKKLVVN
ncbi:T9SS type A sorting domain-containing protein [Gelatiniphilus marinus]|uniref:T9SS type A sorting domain-containing protein n=1 Tax=Gelatiniphilus marinus TaxID=1759464 RepID=A0ABW5JRC8_9FLAO